MLEATSERGKNRVLRPKSEKRHQRLHTTKSKKSVVTAAQMTYGLSLSGSPRLRRESAYSRQRGEWRGSGVQVIRVFQIELQNKCGGITRLSNTSIIEIETVGVGHT